MSRPLQTPKSTADASCEVSAPELSPVICLADLNYSNWNEKFKNQHNIIIYTFMIDTHSIIESKKFEN